jgi:intracellular septation protein A
MEIPAKVLRRRSAASLSFRDSDNRLGADWHVHWLLDLKTHRVSARLSAKEGARVAEQKKLSGVASGLMAFLPFVLYGFAAGANHWRVATGGGLILCLVFLAVRLRRRISIKLMDWTTLTFFVIASVLMLGLRSTVFPAYSVVVIWSCFAVAAWSSVVIGHPFTVAYARENEPPEFWDNPIFIRLNLVMTLFWCGLLTVNAGFAVIGVIIGGNLGKLVPGFALPTALLIFGFVFNSRFPARYLARSGYQGDGASPA